MIDKELEDLYRQAIKQAKDKDVPNKQACEALGVNVRNFYAWASKNKIKLASYNRSASKPKALAIKKPAKATIVVPSHSSSTAKVICFIGSPKDVVDILREIKG